MTGTIDLITFRGKTGADLLEFFLILLVIGFIHESAHGMTCKYFGGYVPQMGFMLIFFSPCFFVDVSDAYMFENHSKRQWVIYAGGYIELFICSFATFLWVLTMPGTVINELAYKTLLLTGLSSVIINYNPLIKLDGYYSLMDYLEIPDLWERSFDYVGNWIKKTVFRLPVELERPTKKVRRILIIYCLLSVAYKMLLIVVVLILLKNVLFGLFGEHAYVAVGLAVLLVMRKSLLKLAGLLKFTLLDKREVLMKPRYLFAIGAVSTLALVGFTLVPVPIVVHGEFTIDPESIALVRPSIEGTVERVLVAEGQPVQPGDDLAILSNNPLARQLPVLLGRIDLCRQEIAETSSRGERALLAKKLRERDLLGEQLQALREEMTALTLRAPIAGVVTTPRLADLEGSWLNRGDMFCEIASDRDLIARVPIREVRMDEIRPGQAVELKLIAYPFRTLTGRVIDLAPASSPESLPMRNDPITEPRPGREFTDFDVIIGLDRQFEGLLYGLAGTARIRIGRSTLARRTTRALNRWYDSQIW